MCVSARKQPRGTPVSRRGQRALYRGQTSLHPWRAHFLLFPWASWDLMNRCSHTRLEGTLKTPASCARSCSVPLPSERGRARAQGPGATVGELKGRCPPGEWGAGLLISAQKVPKGLGQRQLSVEFAAASLSPIAADGAGEGVTSCPASPGLAPTRSASPRFGAGSRGPARSPDRAAPFWSGEVSALTGDPGRPLRAGHWQCSLCLCAPVTTEGSREDAQQPPSPPGVTCEAPPEAVAQGRKSERRWPLWCADPGPGLPRLAAARHRGTLFCGPHPPSQLLLLRPGRQTHTRGHLE